MLDAVKDIHSILSGVARALKGRYESPEDLSPNLASLVERLEAGDAKSEEVPASDREG
jgi:hypothetical protein